MLEHIKFNNNHIKYTCYFIWRDEKLVIDTQLFTQISYSSQSFWYIILVNNLKSSVIEKFINLKVKLDELLSNY